MDEIILDTCQIPQPGGVRSEFPAHRVSGRRPPELPAAPAALVDTTGMEEREQCWNDRCWLATRWDPESPEQLLHLIPTCQGSDLPLKSRIEIQGFRKQYIPFLHLQFLQNSSFAEASVVISVGRCVHGWVCQAHEASPVTGTAKIHTSEFLLREGPVPRKVGYTIYNNPLSDKRQSRFQTIRS